METYEIAKIIEGVLSLSALICFFILCIRVKAIKGYLCLNDREEKKNKVLFEYYLSLGEKEKAKDLIEKMVMTKIKFLYKKDAYKEGVYEKIKEEYGLYFSKVGLNIEPIEEIINMYYKT